VVHLIMAHDLQKVKVIHPIHPILRTPLNPN